VQPLAITILPISHLPECAIAYFHFHLASTTTTNSAPSLVSRLLCEIQTSICSYSSLSPPSPLRSPSLSLPLPLLLFSFTTNQSTNQPTTHPIPYPTPPFRYSPQRQRVPDFVPIFRLHSPRRSHPTAVLCLGPDDRFPVTHHRPPRPHQLPGATRSAPSEKKNPPRECQETGESQEPRATSTQRVPASTEASREISHRTLPRTQDAAGSTGSWPGTGPGGVTLQDHCQFHIIHVHVPIA
jgi:hypothetical protein